MKKVAIFVEGLTERLFVEHLLRHMAGARSLTFEIRKQYRGILHVQARATAGTVDWFVLLADCSGDEQVKTQINDNHASLASQGYQRIFGLRDVYPNALAPLQAALTRGLPSGSPPAEMHLAVMEVEAWFLEEHTHFLRIDPSLVATTVQTAGFSPGVDIAENLQHPAQVLNEIYRLAGASYTKRRRRIERTINALDFGSLIANGKARSVSFAAFHNALSAALL